MINFARRYAGAAFPAKNTRGVATPRVVARRVVGDDDVQQVEELALVLVDALIWL